MVSKKTVQINFYKLSVIFVFEVQPVLKKKKIVDSNLQL